MQNNYILLTKSKDILSFYYGEERSIYCKKTTSNNYTSTIKIIQNVTDCFTVDIDNDGIVHLFCKNFDGDVILCKMEQDGFKNKILFKNKEDNLENVLFYPIFFKDNMSLLFNTQNKNQANSFLAIKTLVGGKTWTNSENIDVFSTLPNNIFYIQKINQDNLVLAYQKKMKDIQIGFKQIKNGNISDFVTIHKTAYQIVDYSFVAYNDDIHYIYVIKTLFSSQVVYKKKDINGISNPVILFDGQKIKSCNIAILNNNLFCSFILNNTLFYCQSEDFGNSFLGIVKYKKPISQDVVKAKFLQTTPILNSSINEIYLESKNPLNIYMLPEFLPNIFNKAREIKQNEYNTIQTQQQNNFITSLHSHIAQEHTPPVVENSHTVSKNVTYLENDFMANFDLDQFSKFNIQKETFSPSVNMPVKIDNADILENKVKMLNSQLTEKNNQILQLNALIQNKNEEKMDIELILRQKIKQLETDNQNLKSQLNSLNVNEPAKTEEIKKDENNLSQSEKQDGNNLQQIEKDNDTKQI